jgi:DNA-binding transcriptional regulator YdaS (Cro superfamily)
MSNAPSQFATPHDALLEAIRRIGSQSKTGMAIGCSFTTVWKWVRNGNGVSDRYVIALEAASGISRRELRPERYWPDEPTPVQVAAPPPAPAAVPGSIPAGSLPPGTWVRVGGIANDNCCCACHRNHPPSAA